MNPDKHATFRRMIEEYLGTVKDPKQHQRQARVLRKLQRFVSDENRRWEEMFTLEAAYDFMRKMRLSRHCVATVARFSEHAFAQGAISTPLTQTSYQQPLPAAYEDYLIWLKRTRHYSSERICQARRVLAPFHWHLQQSGRELSGLHIEDVDRFLDALFTGLSQRTCSAYRSILRAFLAYLYHQRGITRRDFAALIPGPRVFARTQPPRFLRPEEVQKLLDSLDLSSPWHIRQSAVVHLAYFLGLRPNEISRLRLDDVCFSKGEITLGHRKNELPAALPLPEQTLKIMAAYLIGVRGKSTSRRFFLTMKAPFRPLKTPSVSSSIKKTMRRAGIAGSAYWLRHTYAQNLLEAGAGIFEIRDMLGHTRIETTRSYLSVHIRLMREVILDESL